MDLQPGCFFTALKDHCSNLHLRCASAAVPCEDRGFAVIQTMRREFEAVARLLFERIIFEPFNQNAELSISLQNIKNVVIPAVLPDQSCESVRRRCRLRLFHSLQNPVNNSNATIKRYDFCVRINIETA